MKMRVGSNQNVEMLAMPLRAFNFTELDLGDRHSTMSLPRSNRAKVSAGMIASQSRPLRRHATNGYLAPQSPCAYLTAA
jgi:hypothetical protein